MQVLRRNEQSLFVHEAEALSLEEEDLVPVSLSISCTDEEKALLFPQLPQASSMPQVSLGTNQFRNGPDVTVKQKFRDDLLRELRNGWKDTEATEARFIRLVEVLQRDGCAVFAGLIDVERFQQLIDDYSKIMEKVGTRAFLHSFSNLIEHPDFLKNTVYNHAVIHPLLVALMAYMMGGPIRMTDVRGKDTQPISINSQDNMLHIDNSPFREEYKILLGWERSSPRGPSGQNFTFLPGTHKGNRHIRSEESALPWSTENDSIFLTNEAIDGVFSFQKDITGLGPTVVEVQYPEKPISVLFNAASLVHHRYRTEHGSPRSCVIAAFDLASDNPGALTPIERKKAPQSLAELLLGYQNGTQVQTFCSLLAFDAPNIESTINDILNENLESILVDTAPLTLSGDRLISWKESVINAPFTTSIKLEAQHFLHYAEESISQELLIKKLTAAMDYDKHCLLDLIIYQDGHEEVRKRARKQVWTMGTEEIAQRLAPWLPALVGYKFSTADIQQPQNLRSKANVVSILIQDSFPEINFTSREYGKTEDLEIVSARQLIIDLGESITRYERIETYITTNLFLFWAVNQVLSRLDWAVRQEVIGISAVFLRTYVASVLLVEKL
ncbi:MAG: hypothetical protein M1818_003632 [Claussenomyces sp. TS43310]|nr:MAG: hypothetical protein M1818_003632 [Claussenomyces sp. TS43310]